MLGQTHDELWNASQTQFLLDGWMHNNLRMYWAKRFLKWTPSPEIAWQTAVLFNDKLSLDGQDPATYGSLQWGFGRSRAASEAPIYGKVPRKSGAALLKRPGVADFIRATLERRDQLQLKVA